ncbi:agmatine/peptidylarginine deiminase [Thermodesulfobacteriota bacterium]
MHRRRCLKHLAQITLGVLVEWMGLTSVFSEIGITPRAYYMPPEWHFHDRCWMAFASSGYGTWGNTLEAVRREQVDIAKLIARQEPVTMLANPGDESQARTLCGPTLSVLTLKLDDLWIRDTGPTFVCGANQESAAINWNFNVWGNKAGSRYDKGLADRLGMHMKIPMVRAPMVGEGGAIHVDGAGTLLTTESCLLNKNRNPGLSKRDIEQVFSDLLGVRKVIWLPGSTREYITDGHIDGICFFAKPGQVVAQITDDPNDPEYKIMQENFRALQAATGARNKPLEIVPVLPPRYRYIGDKNEDFAASYVNVYLPNRGIVMPKFGDPIRDEAAAEITAEVLPQRKLYQVRIDAIAEGGGGIHCITQQQPRCAGLPVEGG